jgi:hypothetical protein
MDCRNHSGIAAAGACAGCAETYCDNCLVNVRGTRYCAACKGMAIVGARPVAGVPCAEANDALKLAVLSFFCFGIVVGPMAINKAAKARKMIAADHSLTGMGKANAAVVLGVAAVVLWFIGLFHRSPIRK